MEERKDWMMRKVISFSLFFLLIFALGACGLTKKDLGFAKEGPDETLVKTNAPLVLPPEYNVRPQENEVLHEASDEIDE